LAFTADSKTLFSAGWDGAVHRWDVVARKELPLPVGIRGSEVTAASSDGQTLAYKDGTGSIRLVRAKDAVEQEVLKRPGTTYSQLCFAPDGKLLAGGGSSGKNVHVTIWDLDTKKVVHRWEWAKGRDPNSEVEALAFAPKGDRVAAAVFRQSKAYIWDLGSDKQIAKLKHKEIYGLAFSPDGTRLATVGWDEFVRFWDAHTGEARIQAQVQDPTKKNGGDPRMYAVSYSPHDGLLATAQLDGKVRIWNADDMTPRVEFQVPHRFVYGAMCFSPDGLWVATGAQDGTVTLWDSMTGEKVWELGRHRGDVYTVGFGRDNRTLLTGGDDGIGYLWDLRPNEERGDSDLDKLWDAVAGQDAPAAYQAMWKLRDTPERTVPLIAEKLRPVKDVIEPEREEKQLSVDEEYRLKQLKHLLDDKVETVQRSVTVRRAVSLLAEIGTPQAIKVLTDLAQQNPDSYVGRVAATTLERTKASEPRK
jgi:WD40 repeat protein